MIEVQHGPNITKALKSLVEDLEPQSVEDVIQGLETRQKALRATESGRGKRRRTLIMSLSQEAERIPFEGDDPRGPGQAARMPQFGFHHAWWECHRVQVFDKAGKFLFKFGSNGQFVHPWGVTVDQRNNQIVVADSSNHRIQVFDEKGGFIRAFGSSGSGDGQLCDPFDVVVDSQGNYFVAEHTNHRVSVFNSNGQFLGN